MIDAIRNHAEQVRLLCRQFGVRRLEAFGSAAVAGRFDPDHSDIDLLVEFETMEPVQHAKAYFGLLAALQDLFARPVDLIEIKAVTNPYLLESINREREHIYAA